MNSDEPEMLRIDCADCRGAIAHEDRAYATTDDVLLCYDCALRRGAAYDETAERWTLPPHF